MRTETLEFRFVDNIPALLEEGVLYIAAIYGTAIHKCCCGCGSEVVTPLSPAQWQLFFDGETVSLTPSVGSWNLPCQSHYFIRRSRVVWTSRWSPKRIEAAVAEDQADIALHFDQVSKKTKKKKKWWQLSKAR